MGRKEKLRDKLFSKPKDFTWSELETLLAQYGFEQLKGNGSRRKFIHNAKGVLISLHEPHPSKILKRYVVDLVINKLGELGESNE